MPVLQNPSTNDLFGMIRFRTSPLWEFLISLDAAAHSWQFESWTREIQKTLGEDFPVKTEGAPHREFYELAVDAPDHDDIEAFLAYLEEMPIEEFLFYSLGRLIPREKISLPLDLPRLEKEVKRSLPKDFPLNISEYYSWLKNPEGKKEELLALWGTYYRDFYRHRTEDYDEEYRRKFREWQHILEEEGGRALYRHVRYENWFPPPLPAGQEYESIEIIPLHFLPQRQRTYFGYGKITVLSPVRHTPELLRGMEELKEDLVGQLKALGDNSRLEILRLIVESEYQLNGKSLAQKLSLSPSVVSRHLKQLKNAGVIQEKTEDNRNFYYSINREAVLQINRKLLYYLTEKKE